MWIPDKTKLVKVRLHDQGADVETPWAEDCGPAPGRTGARLVRLGNVPFLHAKPTYGDVVLAVPDASDGYLTWDRAGLPWERIGEGIVEDDGRWTMVLDYVLLDPAGDVHRAFAALDVAGEKANIAVEGMRAPGPAKPGRAFLAVPAELSVPATLRILKKAKLPLALTLVHPREHDAEA